MGRLLIVLMLCITIYITEGSDIMAKGKDKAKAGDKKKAQLTLKEKRKLKKDKSAKKAEGA